MDTEIENKSGGDINYCNHKIDSFSGKIKVSSDSEVKYNKKIMT